MPQVPRSLRSLARGAGPVAARALSARHRAVVRRSGLFDVRWYQQQLAALGWRSDDPIGHYLQIGSAAGLSPQPCFESSWYASRSGVPRTLAVDPFVHFAAHGSRRGISPNPLFDGSAYMEARPAAADHPGGALGHYLAEGWRSGLPGSVWLDTATLRDREDGEPPLRALGRQVHTLLRQTTNRESAPRSIEVFDEESAQEFKRDCVAAWRRLEEAPPLVSVIIPTHDRVEQVQEAVRSVIGQTYRNWECVVVDDGSDDDTWAALQELAEADKRIVPVRRDVAGGVSRARNAGLARARGHYVAYLDSDNTWEPDFLEVMVAFVRVRGLRFAYAASALEETGGQGRRLFRAMEFDAQALRERNFIDCIVVLHERALIDEVGAFDTTLRRNVDWELFIRLAEVAEPQFAPFVGTRYDVWEERGNRITTHEPFAFRFAVLARHHVSWSDAELDQETVSIVVHADGSIRNVEATVLELLDSPGPEREIVLVDTQRSAADAWVETGLAARDQRVRLVRHPLPLSTELARTIGATHARGTRIVFVQPSLHGPDPWLGPLVAALDDPSVAVAQPRVVAHDGTIADLGVEVIRNGAVAMPFAGFPEDAPEVLSDRTPHATSNTCLAVRTADFRAVGGFDPLYVNDQLHPDLALRLRAATGGRAQIVSSSTVYLRRPRKDSGKAGVRHYLDNRARFVESHVQDSRTDLSAHGPGYELLGYRHDPARRGRLDAVLHRRREGRPLRWAIKIGPDDVSVRRSWGDWHFAQALKASLERLGQEAVVDCRAAWYRETSVHDDVVLVVRGVGEYVPNPHHTNLLWVISHPDRLTPHEVRAFDAVFAASGVVAQRLARWRRGPVGTLHQCTDPARFQVPTELSEGPGLLFVGNARGVRPSVAAALEAGLEPHVYGVRWAGLVPDALWRGEYVPNEDLARLYASAGVVLNDHWEDMRREGILSNRLFDLAACGARVVTDDVPGLRDVFGDVVKTFDDAESLGSAVRAHAHEADSAREARLELAERVRREHSFDARAAQLVRAVEDLTASGVHGTAHSPSLGVPAPLR